MSGGLITLPLRIWLRSAQLALRLGEELTGRALDAATELVGALAGMQNGDAPQAQAERRAGFETQPASGSRERRRPRARPSRAVPIRPEPRFVPTPEPEAPHVSEQPELVAESAEPGAEEGAGAEITVLEPWEGYRDMGAREVIGRLATAAPAELAAVELYESAHRSRRTVLDSVRRQLRAAGGEARN